MTLINFRRSSIEFKILAPRCSGLERHLDMVEVPGSSPVAPTICLVSSRFRGGYFLSAIACDSRAAPLKMPLLINDSSLLRRRS